MKEVFEKDSILIHLVVVFWAWLSGPQVKQALWGDLK